MSRKNKVNEYFVDNKYDVCTLQTDNKNLSNMSERQASVKMPNDKNYLNVGEGFTRWKMF